MDGGPPVVVWQWGQAGHEGALDAHDWVIDNADGVQSGTTAIHPPALTAGTPKDLIINCGGLAHTELSFYIAQYSGATLDLLVDGNERQSLGGYNNQWKQYVFEVPQGVHTYTFHANSTSDVGTSFALDYFQCKNITPVASTNGTVDFDQGYIPPETGGGWFVDNAIATYSDGSTTAYESGIHPPALKANTPVDMTFTCGGITHTQFTFYIAQYSGATLDLLVDGVERQTLTGYNNQWKQYVIGVTSGAHNYTFHANSTSAVGTSFVLDYFQCSP